MLGVQSIPIPVHECLSVRRHWSWGIGGRHGREIPRVPIGGLAGAHTDIHGCSIRSPRVEWSGEIQEQEQAGIMSREVCDRREI